MCIYLHFLCLRSFQRRSDADPLKILLKKLAAKEQELNRLTAGSPSSYAALVYDKFHQAAMSDLPTSYSRCTDIIDDSISTIDDLHRPFQLLVNEIFQLDGARSAYKAAEKVVRRFKTVVTFLEDMKCELLIGTTELISAHEQGALLYQIS